MGSAGELRYTGDMTDSSDSFLVVLCTTPTSEVGAELARGLVSARLAACVNVVPAVRSFYEWQGVTHDDAESQLLIKTRRSRFQALAAWIAEHHPYSEPEVVALPIVEGSAGYLDWVRVQTEPAAP